jgi:hypothetical protein
MNANDARITLLFTAVDGSTTQDDSPNESGGVARDFYDLRMTAEAGAAVGDSSANYTLTITAFNVSKGVAEPLLNPVGSPFKEEFDTGDNWQPSGDDFVKEEKYDILIDPAVPRGDVYQYTALLEADNAEQISISQSALFALVA